MKSNKKQSKSIPNSFVNNNLDPLSSGSPSKIKTALHNLPKDSGVPSDSITKVKTKTQRVSDTRASKGSVPESINPRLERPLFASEKNSSDYLTKTNTTVKVVENPLLNEYHPVATIQPSTAEALEPHTTITNLSPINPKAEALTLVPAPSSALALVDSPAQSNHSLLPVSENPSKMRPQGRVGAEQIVRDHIPLAVGAGLLPLPGVDLAAIAALQLKMLSALATHYRVPFTRSQAQLIVTSLIGSVGTTLVVGGILISCAKSIPLIGGLIGLSSLSLAGGAITHAMGQLVTDHFETGGTMENFDLDFAKRAFAGKVHDSKRILS